MATKSTTKKTTTKKAAAKKAGAKPKAAAKKATPKKAGSPATAARAAKGGTKAAAKRPAAKNATRANDGARAPKAKKPDRLSLLDAAAQVLAEHKDGLRAREMVALVAERGLWTPGAGKTPHASLYAAIIREISAKGKDARFAKAERGLFVHTGKGA